MGRTPRELGEALTGPELDELSKFDDLFCLPDLFTLAALVCSTLDRGLTTKPRQLHELLPYYGTPSGKPRPIGAEVVQHFRAVAARMAAAGYRPPMNGAAPRGDSGPGQRPEGPGGQVQAPGRPGERPEGGGRPEGPGGSGSGLEGSQRPEGPGG